MEHRCGVRHDCAQTTWIQLQDDQTLIARCRNVSASGAYFEARTPVPLLSPVRVSWNRGAMILTGHVVRTGGQGFAVEWEEFESQLLQPPTLEELPLAYDSSDGARGLAEASGG
jgi:hypothetical protein